MMESQVKSSQVVLMLLLSSLLILYEATIDFVWSVEVEWFGISNPTTVNVEIVLEMSLGCYLLITCNIILQILLLKSTGF